MDNSVFEHLSYIWYLNHSFITLSFNCHSTPYTTNIFLLNFERKIVHQHMSKLGKFNFYHNIVLLTDHVIKDHVLLKLYIKFFSTSHNQLNNHYCWHEIFGKTLFAWKLFRNQNKCVDQLFLIINDFVTMVFATIIFKSSFLCKYPPVMKLLSINKCISCCT